MEALNTGDRWNPFKNSPDSWFATPSHQALHILSVKEATDYKVQRLNTRPKFPFTAFFIVHLFPTFDGLL